MQYVNVLLWALMIVLITAVLCTGIAILWVETKREKWFDEGRVFEREEKELKFKRTTGTRRVKKEKAGDLQKVLDDYEDGIYQRQADYSGMKAEKIVKRVSIYKPKSKRERTK